MPGQRSRSRSRSVRSGAPPTTVAEAELRAARCQVQAFRSQHRCLLLSAALLYLRALELEQMETDGRLARASGR